MDIIIDGIIFENQLYGGISGIYAEILPRICDLDPTVNITILTAAPIKRSLPIHARIRHIAMPGLQRIIPGRWFHNFKRTIRGALFRFAPVQVKEDTIWHSTFYTLPFQWRGLNVLTIPDMIGELFPPLNNCQINERFRVYKRLCAEKSDAIICISKSAASDVLAHYEFAGSKLIFSIPLACSTVFQELPNAAQHYQTPTNKGFLLYVGKRQTYKNFAQLLDTYTKWSFRSSIDLVVVGSPWDSSEQGLIWEFGLEQNIHLLAQISDEDLCCLYNLALAFIYPSLYEGFGIPLVEAMACGCPIVASRIPSSLEVAKEVPIYFDPAQSDDLLHALDLVMQEGRNSDRTQKGLKLAKEYSWDKTAAQTLEVYKTLILHKS